MSGIGKAGSSTTQSQQGTNVAYREREQQPLSPRPTTPKERAREQDPDRDKERSNKSKSSLKLLVQQVPNHVVNQSTKTPARPIAALLSLRPYPDYPGSNKDFTKATSSTSSKYPGASAAAGTFSKSTTNANSNASVLSINRGLRSHKSSQPVHSVSVFDRTRNSRMQVEHAIRDGKIFSIIGVFPAIRRALVRRGWVEKGGPGRNNNALPSIGQMNNTGLLDVTTRAYDTDSENAWIGRMLKGYSPDFVWAYQRENIHWNALLDGQLINRHPNAFFTSKVGITACLHNFHWFSEQGISNTYFPRCYRLCVDEEKTAFIGDYRLCACMGLLKWVVGAYEKDGERGVLGNAGQGVYPACIYFAVRQINHYVRIRRHEDLDWTATAGEQSSHWDIFLIQYYNVVLHKMKLCRSGMEEHDDPGIARSLYDTAKRALQKLAPFWPQLNIDGTSNIWICKPGARSRGMGIILMNELDKILGLLAQSTFRESNWVVQKYVERPMLIFNTKFDIRQWFIISDWNPLTVWFYKESYIRFCSKQFTLEDFHESIHLCNNAVQCRYKNSSFRDSALPDENMWDNYTFQAYLKTLGKMDLWDSVIYPGMKQGILGVLLASQENVIARKGCFELYGADFMLCEDFHPWLIEINSSPCMSSTTRVTARMCPQALEDLVKVTVDLRENRNAPTGLFELIYKQAELKNPIHPFGAEIIIQGKKLQRDMNWPSTVTKCKNKKGSKPTLSSRALASTDQVQVPSENGTSTMSIAIANGQTFIDLIQRLRLKDAQRKSPVEDLESIHGTSAAPTPTAQVDSAPKQRRSATASSIHSSSKGRSGLKHSVSSTKRPHNLQTPAAAHQQLPQVSQSRVSQQNENQTEMNHNIEGPSATAGNNRKDSLDPDAGEKASEAGRKAGEDGKSSETQQHQESSQMDDEEANKEVADLSAQANYLMDLPMDKVASGTTDLEAINTCQDQQSSFNSAFNSPLPRMFDHLKHTPTVDGKGLVPVLDPKVDKCPDNVESKTSPINNASKEKDERDLHPHSDGVITEVDKGPS